MSFARLAFRNVARSRPVFSVSSMQSMRVFRANYSAAAGLSKEGIEKRILDIMKGFEKVDPVKVGFFLHTQSRSHFCALQLSTSSSFTEDLGLDSLDAVEVVMAVEEVQSAPLFWKLRSYILAVLKEFAIEIPDAEADEIKTVQQGDLPLRPYGCALELTGFSPSSH